MTLLTSNTLIPNRVVVAMSGGVDSSVAAALLVEQGYEVVGMMMRLWSEPGRGGGPLVNRCCTPDQMADARRVADQLGIPFYVLDVKDQFRQTIVQYFIEQHELGRTPNPCIESNRQIRFTYLLNQALALDANYLATGHYAQVEQTAGSYRLRQGVDAHKDQSYVLHVLRQEHLAHVLFPVGAYTKSEVRDLARKFGLPVASKHDSQDLCFLGDGDYRRFLREYSEKAAQPGPVLNLRGDVLGQHEGLAFYTIGQRKGLGIATPEPVYVVRKDVTRNALVVGSRAELGQTTLFVRDVNWIAGAPPQEAISAQVKIRYKAVALAALVKVVENGRIQVQFNEPVFGITPGQGAVVYDGDICLGGGIIADVTEQPSAELLTGAESLIED
ncbi:MAG: tRNA 2-thiouridine(34) synthase MnmA [Anaerolineales bacterium]|nr:tRNA 2-thiouridine(34) synthase MnmA [Anaerolineales bacterium]